MDIIISVINQETVECKICSDHLLALIQEHEFKREHKS